MDLRYETYCLVDPIFYDSPAASTSGSQFPAVTGPVPDGWIRSVRDVWAALRPAGSELGMQGWKIHASARVDNAPAVLDTVWRHCVEHRLPFKFLRSLDALRARNSKYADRGGSGKFVTIYPPDEAVLERTLTVLGAALEGQPGPYILSDLRWRGGPLYVRYGGFRERLCEGGNGELVPAIEDPRGRLVPDLREPVFRVPDWVTVPDFLAESLRARSGAGAGQFPYRIQRALHFSNGGGVYVAVDGATGREVLVKEARPFAGLDREGTDAVARLECEHRTLQRLAGLDCVPVVRDYRTWWEHTFLVRDYVEGEPLNTWIVRRHPLLRVDCEPGATEEYTERALRIVERVEEAVAAIHSRGIVFSDLHSSNILVREDDTVMFVDFEQAQPVEEAVRPTLGAPGFVAPASRTGFDIDRYSLGCVRLAVFFPLTPLVAFDDTKFDQFLQIIESQFPVPPGFAKQVWRDVAPSNGAVPAEAWQHAPRAAIWPAQGTPDWEYIRARVTRAVLASATPGRTDRLFPGDIEQFAPGGGVGFGHGAAGVLWALAETGAGRFEEHEEWLLAAAGRLDRPRPGFYNGLSGIAYALDRLGRRAEAREILDRALALPDHPADVSLFSGLPGIGLTLLSFARATGDGSLRAAAERLGERLLARPPVPDRPPRPGLMHGASGAALFLLRLHEATGDPRLLARAAAELRRDLAGCVWTEDRTLQVDEGWRVLPYLAGGSVGIGMVLHEYLRHRLGGDPSGAADTADTADTADLADADLVAAREGIARAARPAFVAQSGLFNGRAGLAAYLMRTAPPGSTVPALDRHVHNLGWNAVPYRNGVAFVGDQLARLSMDLATGSAGVLLVLGAALTGRAACLPFLGVEGEGEDREEVSRYGDRS